MSDNRLTLPNIITVVRIAVSPVIAWMILSTTVSVRYWAFVVFVLAALSDVWDGYLARRYDLVTDIGKLLDPVADKLLLAATFIPFFIISHRGVETDLVPFWSGFRAPLPLWVLVVIFGREIFITLFRSYAAGRGVVIPAGKSGKLKALFQSLFMGGLLLWYPLNLTALERGWSGGFWRFWEQLHTGWVGVTLGVAIVLTIYSMLDYLWSYRTDVGLRS